MLVIATAGLVYELSMAAVASYVIGDSITQFSIVIGLFLSALGLGAYLSRFIERELGLAFVDVELGTALVGGLSAPLLFIAFGYGLSFELLLYFLVLLTGTLVGIELPLLMRILEARLSMKELVSRTLSFDYAGALLGSLGFSLVLVPHLGLSRASVVSGLLSALAALFSTYLLESPDDPDDRRRFRHARLRAILVVAVLGLALVFVPRLVESSESYQRGRIVSAVTSPYQRLLLVDNQGRLELWLNGHLQFSSADERRYHEALVHPVLASTKAPRRVLVGGGGDGLAVRELLKVAGLEQIVLVDLDPEMTRLAMTEPRLLAQNERSLLDPRVTVINDDAFRFVQQDRTKYDVILLDFPDPNNYAVGKLYSTVFYAWVARRLADGGALGIQATSPRLTPGAMGSILATVREVGLSAHPYRIYLPSFGDWGFVLARHTPFPIPTELPSVPLHTLDTRLLAAAFTLPNDARPRGFQVNRLDNQALVATYLAESARTE